MAYERGQYARARALYAAVIKRQPQCVPQVRLGLGLSLFKMNHLDAAEKAFLRGQELQVRANTSLWGCIVP